MICVPAEVTAEVTYLRLRPSWRVRMLVAMVTAPVTLRSSIIPVRKEWMLRSVVSSAVSMLKSWLVFADE